MSDDPRWQPGAFITNKSVLAEVLEKDAAGGVVIAEDCRSSDEEPMFFKIKYTFEAARWELVKEAPHAPDYVLVDEPA